MADEELFREKDKILALDLSGERVEIHTEWCCFTKEEAEEFLEKMKGK